MNEAVLIVVFVLGAIIALALIFKKPITELMGRSQSVDLSVSKDGVNAAFRASVESLERETAATAEAVETLIPEPVKPTGSQQALPGANEAQAEITDNASPVETRQLLAIGADWNGLINEARQLLDECDIPTPENHSSLGKLLQVFDAEQPDILPERAGPLADDADQLLMKLMEADPAAISAEDVRLFSSALASLHRILSKAASKVRHPSRSKRIGA